MLPEEPELGAPASYRKNARKEMLEFVPPSAARVLELGCGEGAFAALLKRHLVAEVWGLELDEEAASVAAEHVDRIIVGDIGETLHEVPKAYFDCVVANDFFEHLQWPGQTLHEIASHLTPGGVVVASIPNLRYCRALYEIVVNRDFKYRNEGIFDATHLRFFTEKSIRRLFDESGYEILTIQGINEERGLWSRVLSALNLILLGSISDTRYCQFAVVARPRGNKASSFSAPCEGTL